MKEKIIRCYQDAKPTNYNILFIKSQIDNLRDRVFDSSMKSTNDETMLLSIICSALKYYVDTSVDGFQESIMEIIIQVEQIYNIDGLIEVVLSTDEI